MPLSTAEKADLLGRLDLFAGLDQAALQQLAERAEEIEFEPGRYIVAQGQVGTGFYLILRGSVRIVRGGDELGDLGPGEFFGEISVIDQEPRFANVVTLEPTRCLALASWDLVALLEENGKVALALLRVVTRRLRSLTEHASP